jgi:endonuclease/exonuclease/phosphatase family metal-dependent hydrolase
MQVRRLLSVVVSAIAISLAGCGDDDDDGGGGGFVYVDDGQLQVMTRNLYLGADLAPVLGATTPEEFLAATAGVFEAVTETNDFRIRAGAIADEIAATRPDLVGLQEVSLWRVQDPGDRATGGTTPATTVVLDFLALLQGELNARGLPYVVAEEIELFDLEAPVPITTTVPPATIDVRLTDRQVILAISGLPTSNPRSGVFSTLLPIPDVLDPSGGTTTLIITRGWTAVDATVGGQQLAFYNTHLEAFGPGVVRIAQATELATDVLGPDLLSTVAQVLVGDLNSTPGTEGHGVVTLAGFDDLWAAAGAGDGFTCCFDADLTVSTATLDQRIDYVLWRGPRLTPTATAPPTIVGDELGDRTGTPPRWPSDHAGVFGTFDPAGATTP